MKKSCKLTEEIAWAVEGPYGLYRGTAPTKKKMKKIHMEKFGYSKWSDCKRNGDQCVEVRIITEVKVY